MPKDSRPPFTHTAFIWKREGKRPHQGRWLECGVGRLEADGNIFCYLDRLPTGGFTGRVHMVKRGQEPAPPEPERPGDAESDDDQADA
jgi:hypothetical protein